MRRLSLLPAILLALCVFGCGLFKSAAIGDRFEYETSKLDSKQLGNRLSEGNRNFFEETAESVRRALDIYLDSISPRNEHRALWHAARASYWLGLHLEDEEERIHYSRLGARIGREATVLLPDAASSHFYYAANLGLLSRLEARGLTRIPILREEGLRVIELDERFAEAGGHRFLGVLYDKTKDNPLIAVGDIDDALEHLERACELFPDYGYNQLALAEVLIQDEEYAEARTRLEKTIASQPIPGHGRSHAKWVARARVLLVELDAH